MLGLNPQSLRPRRTLSALALVHPRGRSQCAATSL
jgi:hypothetical protein